MKITYLELPDGDKLISYHRHDFKSKEIDGELYYIDGGQSGDYIRVSNPGNKAILKQVELEEIFDFIRNDFYLEGNIETGKILLKEVEYNMVEIGSEMDNLGIWKEFFKLELKYRNESKRNKKK